MGMSRVAGAVLALATAVTLTACGAGAEEDAAAASSSVADVSRKAEAEARRSASNASASASEAAAAASSSAAAASASAAAEAARKVPVVFTGSGDDVVNVTKPPGVTAALATITYNGGSNFAVKGVDGDQDLLVNVIGSYSGTTLMDADNGGTTQLQVTASGPWSITLADPLSAPPLNRGANTGTGDAVLIYQGARGVATISGQGDGNFAVIQTSASGRDLLVNEIGAYNGTVPLAAGPAFVEISSEGTWSIEVR